MSSQINDIKDIVEEESENLADIDSNAKADTHEEVTVNNDEDRGYEKKDGKNEIDVLKEQIKAKTIEASENFDKLLRLKAEFENYKKRTSKEHNEYYKYANEKITGELLAVMDNLERAIVSADQNHDNIEAFKKGVRMIAQQFTAILENAGLKEIKSLNTSFDPAKHEAVSQRESDEYEENTVIEEFQRGYFFKDRVLRHSKVVVSKKPEQKDKSNQKPIRGGEDI